MWPFARRKPSPEANGPTRRTRAVVQGVPAKGGASWLRLATLVGFTALVILVCFVGLSPLGPVLREGQIARVRVVAERNFSYISEVDTEALRAERRQQVPPVFRINMQGADAYGRYLAELVAALNEYVRPPEGVSEEAARVLPEELDRFLATYPAGNPYHLTARDFVSLINDVPEDRRNELVQEGLYVLREILAQGVYDPSRNAVGQGSGQLSLFRVTDAQGGLAETPMQSLEEGLRALRINTIALDVPRATALALYRLLRPGLVPNLEFDEAATEALLTEAEETVPPVRRYVQAGDTLIEPFVHVTPRHFEQLEAYRLALAESRDDGGQGLPTLLFERSLLSFLLVVGSVTYLRLMRSKLLTDLRSLALTGAVMMVNLAVIRLILEVGSSRLGQENDGLLSILPYLLPVAFGPMIIGILVGPGAGVMTAAVIGMLHALMMGGSLYALVVAFAAALVGVVYSRNIQIRARVVRAGLFSGIVLASAALFQGLRDSVEWTTVVYQVLASLGTGGLTGIMVVGTLPLWEVLFRHTSDITLLELTDFNHPLLRRLQAEAPGSYHHSLMVANLAENAASAIGANPLLCRVCALFHDIGKITKPEYFAENQRDGYNPHEERNPSMSALVIKSHVKDGVALARQAKLPQVVQDVIRQHHGTSLIQFFFHKAREERRQDPASGDQVDEETFRYEGPKPQFLESAVVMLADSVEAASRSLRKATPQAIEELIAGIVRARLDDGQLDDTPITVKQLSQVQVSLNFSVLNMLHSRVEYPEGAEKKRKAEKRDVEGAPAEASGKPSLPLATPESRAAQG